MVPCSLPIFTTVFRSCFTNGAYSPNPRTPAQRPFRRRTPLTEPTPGSRMFRAISGPGPAPSHNGAQHQAVSAMRHVVKAAWGWAEPCDGYENPRQVSPGRHGSRREKPRVSRSLCQAVRRRLRRRRPRPLLVLIGGVSASFLTDGLRYADGRPRRPLRDGCRDGGAERWSPSH
jgi:hypothetical protein